MPEVSTARTVFEINTDQPVKVKLEPSNDDDVSYKDTSNSKDSFFHTDKTEKAQGVVEMHSASMKRFQGTADQRTHSIKMKKPVSNIVSDKKSEQHVTRELRKKKVSTKRENVLRFISSNVSLTSSTRLSTHLSRRNHRLNYFTCQFCSHTTKRINLMKLHIQDHTIHKIPVIKCSKCDYASFKLFVNRHMNENHVAQVVANAGSPDRQSTGYKYDNSFTATFATSSKKQIKTNKNKEVFQCKRCLYNTCSGKHILDKHVKEFHSKLLLVKLPKYDFNLSVNRITRQSRLVEKINLNKKNDTGKKKTYQCNFCSFSNFDSPGMNHHIRRVHIELKLPIVKCSKCNYKSNGRNVTSHLRSVHKTLPKKVDNVAQCSYCSYNTKNYWSLENHMKIHTKSKLPLIQCSKCDYKSHSKNVTTHSRLVHNIVSAKSNLIGEIRTYHCEICSYSTDLTKDQLDRHVRRVHIKSKLPLVKCSKCNYKSNGRNVTCHLRSVHKTLPKKVSNVAQCSYCSYNTKIYWALEKHMKIHTKSKLPLIQCSKCDYKSSSQNVTIHACLVHNIVPAKSNLIGEKRTYHCEICSYSTQQNKNQLDRHVRRVHIKSKLPLVKCTKCDYKSFNANVTKHFRSVHEKLPKKINNLLKCSYCSYSNSDYSRLMKHIKVHTIKKLSLVKCSKCDYKSNGKNVAIHSRLVHRRLPQCPFCSFSSNSHHKIKKHMKSHTKSKAQIVKCFKCDYKSTLKNVNCHAFLNHGTLSHCPACPFSTKSYRMLLKHVKVHKISKYDLVKCSKCDYKSTLKRVDSHYRSDH